MSEILFLYYINLFYENEHIKYFVFFVFNVMFGEPISEIIESSKRNHDILIGPKEKKSCVQVPRPTLDFCPDPKAFKTPKSNFDIRIMIDLI